ncbi:MAG TPA: lipocalin-like domain-containing protein [Nitrospira sp.]|nr:lipocalin-like domain-containing protein [Nitrospira sp.]
MPISSVQISPFAQAVRRGLHVIMLCAAGMVGVPSIALSEPVSPSSFEQAAAGYRYEFPRDHGSHPSYRTEWWYYTGHLQTKTGRLFGYELTFFRRAVSPEDIKTQPSQWTVSHLYLAHFAVTDVAGRRFHFSEKLSRAGLGKAGAEESRLYAWIDDWRADAQPAPNGMHTLFARDGTATLDLQLLPAKPLVVHGRDGISRKGAGEGNATHYYSFTRLETTGSVTIGTERFEVTGTSWMDHEFGSTDLGSDLAGWDWFSIQLDDRSELMLYRLRRKDGGSDLESSGTVVLPDGKTRHLSVSDIRIESTGTWTSRESKAVYPSTWRIAVPSMDLALEVMPLLADQELRTSRSTQVTYWEGAVSVSGIKQGRSVKGQGYVELTGYAERIMQKM